MHIFYSDHALFPMLSTSYLNYSHHYRFKAHSPRSRSDRYYRNDADIPSPRHLDSTNLDTSTTLSPPLKISLKDWVCDLLGLSRKPSQSQRRAREERRRKYNKRLRETRTPRPRLDVRISQPAHQWSQSMGDLLDNRWTPTPRLAPQRGSSVPVRPPPRTYQRDSGRARAGSVRVPPSMPRRPVEVTPSNSSMDFEIVEEIIATIGRAFPHIPYAVTGLAAMVHHGYTQRHPRAVTILCPSTARDVVRCWAVAQGMYRVHDDPDAFGILTSERNMRAMQIQFISPAAFDEVEITRTRSGGAKVVALETLAEKIARAYVSDLANNSARGHPMKRQYGYAQDMRFVLKKMVRGGERLSYRTACSIVRREFWLPFTLSFPDTVPLFEYLGLSALADEDGRDGEEGYCDDGGEDYVRQDAAMRV